MTEVSRNARSEALVIPGTTLAHINNSGISGGDECALVVKTGRIVRKDLHVLSDLPISDRGSNKIVALTATIDFYGAQLVVSVAHMPAHIEGADGFRDGIDSVCFKDSVRTWGALARQWALHYDGVILSADWNVSFRRTWVNRYMAAALPDLVNAWDGRIPASGGTHGSYRIIDGLFTNLPVEGCWLEPDDESSDHRPMGAAFTIPEESMSRGVCPFALQRPIAPGANDPKITPTQAILHVDANNAESLYYYFRDRSGGIESHFHVRKDGVIEQYRNIFRQADANYKANDEAVSIETQGFGHGVWNLSQLNNIKRLLRWIHEETAGDVPMRVAPAWDSPGVGYHILYDQWHPVAKACPGPDRIDQFWNVIRPWLNAFTTDPTPPEVDVPTDNELLAAILAELKYQTNQNAYSGVREDATMKNTEAIKADLADEEPGA